LNIALTKQEKETVLWTRDEFWIMENVELEEYRDKNIYRQIEINWRFL